MIDILLGVMIVGAAFGFISFGLCIWLIFRNKNIRPPVFKWLQENEKEANDSEHKERRKWDIKI